MTDKIQALELDNEQWHKYLAEMGEPSYRADQICEWLWRKHTDNTEGMTNLSKVLREKLAEAADFSYPVLAREQRSSDGTKKFLWQLADGESVESVLMKNGDRLTVCISTQVGCPLACTFCATGLSGFVRSLTAGEIAGQVLAVEKHVSREVNNVVYMGMGEPFLNTEAVLRSVRMLNSPKLRNFGIRRIAISTSGVVPGIKALAASGLGVRLAVSLHAANDDLRSYIMPVNENWPLGELRNAMQDYQDITGDRITIEYSLFGGVNDSVIHARELVRYLMGLHVFVNLIPYNAVAGRYEKPKPEDVLRFRTVLQTAGFETEIRSEHGGDIDAACGQLRRKTVEGTPAPFKSQATASRHTERRTSAPKRSNSYREELYPSHRSRATRPSGGYIDERGGRRRKKDLPPKERYRSGKMKEARPTYRAQNSDFAPYPYEDISYEDSYENRQNRERESYRGERRSYGEAKSRGYGRHDRDRRGSWDSRRSEERGERGGFDRFDKSSHGRRSANDGRKGSYSRGARRAKPAPKEGAFSVFYGKSRKPKKSNRPRGKSK